MGQAGPSGGTDSTHHDQEQTAQEQTADRVNGLKAYSVQTMQAIVERELAGDHAGALQAAENLSTLLGNLKEIAPDSVPENMKLSPEELVTNSIDTLYRQASDHAQQTGDTDASAVADALKSHIVQEDNAAQDFAQGEGLQDSPPHRGIPTDQHSASAAFAALDVFSRTPSTSDRLREADYTRTELAGLNGFVLSEANSDQPTAAILQQPGTSDYVVFYNGAVDSKLADIIDTHVPDGSRVTVVGPDATQLKSLSRVGSTEVRGHDTQQQGGVTFSVSDQGIQVTGQNNAQVKLGIDLTQYRKPSEYGLAV